MNSSIIRYILGNVMRMEACFLLLPCIVSLVYGEGVGLYYLGTAIVCLAFGVVMAWTKPKNYVFYLKEDEPRTFKIRLVSRLRSLYAQ